MRALPLLSISLLAAASAAPAQSLRHAVGSADVVVVATLSGSRDLGENLTAHQLTVHETLKGKAPAELSVVHLRGVCTHQGPDGEQRLYCLSDFSKAATRADLPSAWAPYFKMTGHAGGNPAVADPDNAPECELARIVIDSEAGTAAKDINRRLMQLVLFARDTVRTEAVQLLTERPVLLGALDSLQLSNLMSRAVGETEDIPFKIALAELCAERHVEGLVDALCISVDEIDDPRFARALGRLARYLHGENAVDVLRPHIVKRTRPEVRSRLLLALGATSTERALEALLRMRSMQGGDKAAVDAALRAHGSRRAKAAVGQK